MSKVVTVGELTKYLANLIAGDNVLRNLAVTGEISNFKRYTSGHCYFNLKDKHALIPCVMFRGSAMRLRFQPKDGMQVIASGNVTVYEDGGRYQLYVSAMAPDGIGDLAMAFEQLKERLGAEGLFDEAHKQPLPLYPRTIGIVTSQTGAVLRDIYRVSKRRFPAIQLILHPVQVQGKGAAEQIADAIDYFNKHYPVDVLIVGRGGGSIEDLWAFNEEVVVRAIYRSKIPVISAVGHETDFTLADFAADQRAATPSQAAELAVRDARELERHIKNLLARFHNAAWARLDNYMTRLRSLVERPALKDAHTAINQRKQKLDLLFERLQNAAGAQITSRQEHVTQLAHILGVINPMQTVARGYAMLEDTQGKPVTAVESLHVGEKINIRLRDGFAQAEIKQIGRYKDAT